MDAFIANFYLNNQPNGTLFEGFHKKNNLIKHLEEECGFKEVTENVLEKENKDGTIIRAVITRIQVQDTYLY